MNNSKLPDWALGTLAVAGVGVFILTGYFIKKAIDRLIESRDERELERAEKDELQNLAQQGVTPTLSDANALSLSNVIESSLSGCELTGTEKEVVDQIVSLLNNQADWIKLQQKFGTRMIDNCGYGTGDTSYTLKALLTEQLDSTDWSFTTYLSILKTKLQAKSITF